MRQPLESPDFLQGGGKQQSHGGTAVLALVHLGGWGEVGINGDPKQQSKKRDKRRVVSSSAAEGSSLGPSCPVLEEAGGCSAGEKLPDRLKTTGRSKEFHIPTAFPFKEEANIVSPKGRLGETHEGQQVSLGCS